MINRLCAVGHMFEAEYESIRIIPTFGLPERHDFTTVFWLMSRKTLAIYGLILFVVGTLLVPAMHRLELACAGGGATEDVCHSCCSHKHSDHHDKPDGSRDSHPNKKPHDESTCSICQLAKTPVSSAVVDIALPQFEPVAIVCPVVPSQPDFQSPRLLPFSCGPPA
jgi:hypothetical protein